MSNLNKCIFTGNLTRAVDLRKVGAMSCADFSLAINESWKDKNNELQEDVSFLEFTAWGKHAESLAQHKGKGDQLTVVCRARQDRWTVKDDKGNPLKDKDGKEQKRSKVKFIADEIHFGPKRQASEQDQREADRAGRRDSREESHAANDGADDGERRDYNDSDVPAHLRGQGGDGSPPKADVDAARQQFAGSTVGKPEVKAAVSAAK